MELPGVGDSLSSGLDKFGLMEYTQEEPLARRDNWQ